MKIRKKVTLKKAAAQKDNAAKSTGPKSQRGKFFASQNAISHGIFARDMLLPGESKKEFDQLRRETISSWCPVGSREFRRVEKLVWNDWRHKRHYLAESGVIAKLLADHETMAEMTVSTHVPQYNRAVAVLGRLEEIEEQIHSAGYVSTENLGWLRKLPYGDELKNFIDVIELVKPLPLRKVQAQAQR